jgi:hypothetical protein
MANPAPPTLSLTEPPRKLGQSGLTLWNRVQSEFAITDCGGIELLLQAALTMDRLEQLEARIAADGVTLTTPQGLRSHPCLKEEFAARRLLVAILRQLGLTEEAIKAPGRPAGKAWSGYVERRD